MIMIWSRMRNVPCDEVGNTGCSAGRHRGYLLVGTRDPELKHVEGQQVDMQHGEQQLLDPEVPLFRLSQ